MGTKHIRHLVTELAARLSDRDFLRKAGISRRTMQEIFVRDKWEEALESLFPIRERLSCKQILELCHPELWALSGEPEEGWISFTYKFSTHILYPDPEFSEKAASYARGAYVYLNVLQFFFDEERKAVPFDPFNDFALLGEEEYQSCDRAGEYGRFVREFRDQYIYEMMRLNREATPFETLSHIAGVHHVAMTVARGLKRRGSPSTWLYPREPLPAMIWGNLAASPMNGSLTFTITIPTSGSWPIRWRASAISRPITPPGIWSWTILPWSPWS